MCSYQEKIENLKARADELNKKIPVYVKAMPDVKKGLILQAEVFELMDKMAAVTKGISMEIPETGELNNG